MRVVSDNSIYKCHVNHKVEDNLLYHFELCSCHMTFYTHWNCQGSMCWRLSRQYNTQLHFLLPTHILLDKDWFLTLPHSSRWTLQSRKGSPPMRILLDGTWRHECAQSQTIKPQQRQRGLLSGQEDWKKESSIKSSKSFFGILLQSQRSSN